MKTKYTKGPWKVDPKAKLRVCAHNGYTVAYGYTVASCGNDSDIELEEAQANAHLIAAAPDMFEALELFLKIEDGPDEQHAVVMNTMKAYAKMREAVKKAKGE